MDINNESFGLLAQNKLDKANTNQNLKQLSKNIEISEEANNDYELNKDTNQWNRIKKEWDFKRQKQLQLEKANIYKKYKDKKAYNEYLLDKDTDVNGIFQNGIIPRGLSITEQKILGQNGSYEQYLQNRLNRERKLDLRLQENQDYYNKIKELIGLEEREFNNLLEKQDEEFRLNLQASKLSNSVLSDTYKQFNTYASNNNGMFDTSYWAALKDGTANFLDSLSDLPRGLYHYLMNGNLNDFEPNKWFERNFGGNYADVYSSPLSNQSWFDKTNIESLIGMGIQSIPEMVGLIGSFALTKGLTAPLLGKRVKDLLTMSNKLRSIGKLEQAMFLSGVAKILPTALQAGITVGGIEGVRRGLQVASDRKDIYGGKFNFELEDYLTGVASSALDFASLGFGLKGVGSQWNKILPQIINQPKRNIPKQALISIPKLSEGLIKSTTPSMLIEGGTEFIQTALELSRIHGVDLSDFIDVMSSDNAKYNGLKHQLLDATVTGALVGGGISVLGQSYKGIKDTKEYINNQKNIKKQIDDYQGNSSIYYVSDTNDENVLRGVQKSFSSTIDKMFNSKDLPKGDVRQFKNLTDSLNHSYIDNIVKLNNDINNVKDTNSDDYKKLVNDKKDISKAYDDFRIVLSLLHESAGLEKSKQFVDKVNKVFNNSKNANSIKEDTLNIISEFILSDDKILQDYKKIIYNNITKDDKDLSSFFKQFFEVTPDEKQDTKTNEELKDIDNLNKEVYHNTKELFEDNGISIETNNPFKNIKVNNVKRRKFRSKDNVKSQLNPDDYINSSPVIQEENNLELDKDIKVKQEQAKRLVKNLLTYMTKDNKGIQDSIKLLNKKSTNINDIISNNLKDILYKSNDYIKNIFNDNNQDITNKEIEILKDIISRITNPVKLYNQELNLKEFNDKIIDLQRKQYQLIDYSFKQSTNIYANFQQEKIDLLKKQISEQLDYFSNFIKYSLSDFYNLDYILNETQKDIILSNLESIKSPLEVLIKQYEDLLNITNNETLSVFDNINTENKGILDNLISYILKLVDKATTLGKMFILAFDRNKFNNKEQLKFAIDKVNKNFLEFNSKYNQIKILLNGIKQANKEVKYHIESSPLFLDANGVSKGLKIGNNDIFLTKKSSLNLSKYEAIFKHLEFNNETLNKYFENIRKKLTEVSNNIYAKDHLYNLSFSGLLNLINSPYNRNEIGQIDKIDYEMEEARNLIAKASVIAILNTLSSRNNDKHNIDSNNYNLISAKEIDIDIINRVQELLHTNINDKDLQLGIVSLGFLLLKESDKNNILQFNKYSFSDKVFKFVKSIKNLSEEDRASKIKSFSKNFKSDKKIDTIINVVNSGFRQNKNIFSIMDSLQSDIPNKEGYINDVDNIVSSYFVYPINKISIYNMVLESYNLSNKFNNNLEDKLLPIEKPIIRNNVSKVVNDRNKNKYTIDNNLIYLLNNKLNISIDDIEEVPSVTKTNINAIKNEYELQGNLINSKDTSNPNFFFPIYNSKNPNENIKYYKFKDFNKYENFLNQLGFEDTVNNYVGLSKGSKLVESFSSKIRQNNHQIGELLTILLFPENYNKEFYYEFEEQNQQRLQIKTWLFNTQDNKLIRPLINLKEWFNNGEYITQDIPKTYENMSKKEKDGIIQALALIITNNSFDKPTEYNSETGILEYKFNNEFPDRESIKEAIQSEEGRNKLIPYLDNRIKELKLNDEPYISINSMLIKDWFEKGFKEFNPNSLLIELDGRSTAIFEQSLHLNTMDISNKLGLVKGYIDSNPIEKMIRFNAKPVFKERNTINDVKEALYNNLPYGNIVVKAMDKLNIDLSNSSSKTIFSSNSSRDYPDRTKDNIEQSDFTLAFYTDPTTSGEKLTKKIALGQDKYKGFFLPDNKDTPDEEIKSNVKQIIKELIDRNINLNSLNLNIAGNGSYEYKNKTQEQLNNILYRYLKEMHNQGVDFSLIRSGGQTGIDEAGIKAAQMLGIPTLVHGTSDYKYREDSKNDKTYMEEHYKKRFSKNDYDLNNTSNTFEVSTNGNPLGEEFSALNAKFNEDFKLKIKDKLHLIKKGMTIEEAYQTVIKQSGKKKPPSENSVLFNPNLEYLKPYLSEIRKSPYANPSKSDNQILQEELSYRIGYLPLWKEWAKQNPILMNKLATIINSGKELKDSYATTLANQARALTEIVKANPDLITESNIQSIGITKNPYIDTLLSLNDISTYTNNEYLTKDEANTMYKSLRDIGKKFLIPISYGSNINNVITNNSKDSLYSYLVETLNNQFNKVLSLYNKQDYKDFSTFLITMLNPNNDILDNTINNPKIKYHIKRILQTASRYKYNEDNIGEAFDYYLNTQSFLNSLYTIGNELNLKTLIEINDNKNNIDDNYIKKLNEAYQKIQNLDNYSFKEIMDWLIENKKIKRKKDYVEITLDKNSEDEVEKKISEYTIKPKFLYQLSNNHIARDLYRYLYLNPDSYKQEQVLRLNSKTNTIVNTYNLRLKNGFVYDSLDDYSKTSELRGIATELMDKARYLKFKKILQDNINNVIVEANDKDDINKIQEGLLKGLDEIDNFLNKVTKDKYVDSFQLSKIKENVSSSEIFKIEEKLKTLINELEVSDKLIFNPQVITSFENRGSLLTTNRIKATISRIAFKTTIHLIEHNLEGWVMNNIISNSPVVMSIYDAGITSLVNAKDFQDNWNKYFEKGNEKIELYSLPITLLEEYKDTLPEVIKQNPNKWDTLVRNTNYIYPIDFNNIMLGDTKTDSYKVGDLKSYTIKDNPYKNVINLIKELSPITPHLPLLDRNDSIKNELISQLGQDIVDNSKYLNNDTLILPKQINSTTQSELLGKYYDDLKNNKINDKEFLTKIHEEMSKGLILPSSFGNSKNNIDKNEYIKNSVIKVSKALDLSGNFIPPEDIKDIKVKNQLDIDNREFTEAITEQDINLFSTKLNKDEVIKEVNDYINSLEDKYKNLSKLIFDSIMNNIPDNLQFLHNPNISSKGLYVQDGSNHYIILSDNTSPNTVLHEIIHASISNAFDRTVESKNIVSEIGNIMEYTRNKLDNDTNLMKQLNLLDKDRNPNIIYEQIFVDNDISEFLAYFLTDKEKIDFLNGEKSINTLKGTIPANANFIGKAFNLLGRLIKAVVRLFQLNTWKNYNRYRTLDETLSDRLIKLSDFNKENNYKKSTDKLYLDLIKIGDFTVKGIIGLIVNGIFSNIETYAEKNNLTTEQIEKEINNFKHEFLDDFIDNPNKFRTSFIKLLNPVNTLNPIRRRAIWEVFGMLQNTKSGSFYKSISQILLNLQLYDKDSDIGQTLRRAEDLSNKITYNMSQEELGYSLTKKQITELIKNSLGDKYNELEQDEKSFKQPSVEQLSTDIYNRKQYSRLIQLERDIGGIVYNLKLSDALPYGYDKEISNDDILTLLKDTFISNEVEINNRIKNIKDEVKINLFNLISKEMNWNNINDIPEKIINYIVNSTEILGYSRLSRQTSKAGFTNVEDIMRRLHKTELDSIFQALSNTIDTKKSIKQDGYRQVRVNYHDFFNSLRKLTTYQAIKSLNKNTKSSKYHQLMINNIKKEFNLNNEITNDFSNLMTSILVLHSSYNRRNRTVNRYKPVNEAKILKLEEEYNSLVKDNINPQRQKQLKEEILELDSSSYNRYNDFRDADFRESYYLDSRVPYSINSDISLKFIQNNRDSSYYQYLTNNKNINTKQEAIDFLLDLGYRFIDENGKIFNVDDKRGTATIMRYDGFNKYEDKRVNTTYLGSSEMNAGNLLSDSSLDLEKQNKIKGKALKESRDEIKSLINNTWQFNEEIFENSYREYRPLGSSNKEFRTILGRLAHNNMTEVDTRISELLANENKEITRNTTIEKVNVDLARALIKDNEMFKKSSLYTKEIEKGSYVKIFDLINPQTIDKEFYEKISSDAFDIFKKVLLSYNEDKLGQDKITELYLNPLTTTYFFGFTNSKYSNSINNPKFRKIFNSMETFVENLFRENKTNVIIRNPKVVIANGLSNIVSLTGLGYPLETILSSIEPLQNEILKYKVMQKELFQIENNIISLKNLEELSEEDIKELNSLEIKKDRIINAMSKSRVHIPMQNGFDTNIIDETLQEPDYFDNIYSNLSKYIPLSNKNSSVFNELLMTNNSQYYQNLQNLNKLGDLIPKILAYEFSLEEGKSKEEAIKFSQDFFINYNIPITSPFLRGVQRTGVGFYLKYGLRIQRSAFKSFMKKPVSTVLSLIISNLISPSLISPVGGESFISKGLPIGQSLDLTNYFRHGFLFKSF